MIDQRAFRAVRSVRSFFGAGDLDGGGAEGGGNAGFEG